MCCDILRFCWCDWPTVCSNILRFVGVRMGRLVKLLQHVIFCVCRSGRVLVATFLFRWSCVCAIMCRCVVRSFLDVVHGFCEIVVTFGSIVLRKRHVRHVGCCCCCCCACDMCCDILRFEDADSVRVNRAADTKLVEFDKLKLPQVPKLAKGYHYGSDLSVAGLENLKVHVVWDGGAEGTTLSASAASRILFAQADVPETSRRGLVNLGRQPRQRFHGFASESAEGDPIIVDVQGSLLLGDPVSKNELPEFQMIPEVKYSDFDRDPSATIVKHSV